MNQLAYQVTVQPATEPFTLAEAKERIEVEASSTLDDAYITDLIVAARQAAENYTNRAFFTQTVKQSFEGFPTICKMTPRGEFVLAKNQVQSIVSITYTDEAGAEVVMDAAAVLLSYRLNNIIEPARLQLKSDKSHPTIEVGSNVVIEYVAGWTHIAKVPAVVKQAMVFWMREAFDNVGNPPSQKITAFERALSFYKIEWI